MTQILAPTISLIAVTAIVASSLPRTPLSPQTVAQRLQQRFDQLSDYECVMKTETRAGTRVEAATFRVWYRRPGLFRLRVLQGRQRGSELVVESDGTLRGRRGGLLRPFSRRLSRSDPSLRSLRGQPAWELDMGSFLRSMRQRMEQPASSAILQEPQSGARESRLEVRYRASGEGPTLRDVWVFDPSTWLLVAGDVFDGEERVDHFEISEFKIDTGLKESLFRF
jgi:outer membrane lipoprotein-sorting protein